MSRARVLPIRPTVRRRRRRGFASATWHRPVEATPTTHILKLPLGIVGGGLQLDLSDSVDNECLYATLFEAMHLPPHAPKSRHSAVFTRWFPHRSHITLGG